MKQITIIGDSEAQPEALTFAERVGEEIAKSGFSVLTGGRGGIMEAANKGAFNAGGLSIGILPSDSMNEANDFCHIVIPTGLGHARNTITALACDAIVAIGGGAGTLSELCFSWIHQKPIFVFPQFGGWSEKLTGNKIDSRSDQPIIGCDSAKDLILKLNSFLKD